MCTFCSVGRNLSFLTMFRCLYYFYLSNPVILFLFFFFFFPSHRTGLILFSHLCGERSSKIFQEACVWVSRCCLQPHLLSSRSGGFTAFSSYSESVSSVQMLSRSMKTALGKETALHQHETQLIFSFT